MLASTKVIRQLVREAVAKQGDDCFIYKSWTDKSSYVNPSSRRRLGFLIAGDPWAAENRVLLRLKQLGFDNPVRVTAGRGNDEYLRIDALLQE